MVRVRDVDSVTPILQFVVFVNEFPEVFPYNLLGIPHEREIYLVLTFSIICKLSLFLPTKWSRENISN